MSFNVRTNCHEFDAIYFLELVIILALLPSGLLEYCHVGINLTDLIITGRRQLLACNARRIHLGGQNFCNSKQIIIIQQKIYFKGKLS